MYKGPTDQFLRKHCFFLYIRATYYIKIIAEFKSLFHLCVVLDVEYLSSEALNFLNSPDVYFQRLNWHFEGCL